MISGERRQNSAILSTSLIMNLRKLHAKRCAIGPSSRFFSEAPSETLKNKNTYCKTHDKISVSRWRMKPLPISFKNQRNVFFYRQGRNVRLDLIACLRQEEPGNPKAKACAELRLQTSCWVIARISHAEEDLFSGDGCRNKSCRGGFV